MAVVIKAPVVSPSEKNADRLIKKIIEVQTRYPLPKFRPIKPSGLQAIIDPKTGCVRPAPFRDRDGRLLEWIPWDEV
jgi:hypothetical protein